MRPAVGYADVFVYFFHVSMMYFAADIHQGWLNHWWFKKNTARFLRGVGRGD